MLATQEPAPLQTFFGTIEAFVASHEGVVSQSCVEP
jgi:hypothetical protein